MQVLDGPLHAAVLDDQLLVGPVDFKAGFGGTVAHRVGVDRLRPALEHHRRVPLVGRRRPGGGRATAVVGAQRRVAAALGLRVVAAEADRGRTARCRGRRGTRRAEQDEAGGGEMAYGGARRPWRGTGLDRMSAMIYALRN